MKGDIDLIGGPNFERLYHKLKVLLLFSCNHMMQLIGYRQYILKLVVLVKLAFAMQRLKKYLKFFCHNEQRCGGDKLIFTRGTQS